MPVILDWRDAGAWMTGADQLAHLHPPPEDALQEWIVSPRVNRSGVGDDDASLIELVCDCLRGAASRRRSSRYRPAQAKGSWL